MKAQPVVLPLGKAEIIRDGDEIAVLGLGALLPMAAELADALEREGRSAAVINPRFVKPLDREMLAQYARKVQAFVTFEDHVLMGGFGSRGARSAERDGLPYAGGAHRLAGPLYRARQGRSAAGEARHQRRGGAGKAGAAAEAIAEEPTRRALNRGSACDRSRARGPSPRTR